jgi:uncharacterized protein (DUF1501 family)
MGIAGSDRKRFSPGGSQEPGFPLTLVNFSLNQDWDTHANNFQTLKTTRLPELDRAVSALLDDLEERGQLESTLVAVITEFGRTPKINPTAGRDHWSDVFSVLLAGGGLKSGLCLGSSNPRGEIPPGPSYSHQRRSGDDLPSARRADKPGS